ncbi:unnamed protein product [Eruca vesicaria subsp. sativa]|uniref:Uncharacterized protein n=1 Tax=Eruca vesicaria subsp. sativa TaxID=29727 RepID=A0ABC8KTP8_ERUVS|nr:unnamed protein product [Eruca vesicaria subsp. sativa]
MDSASTHRTLVEEREEIMVLPSEINTRPTIKKSHLLKPYVPTIDGSETSLRPASSPCSIGPRPHVVPIGEPRIARWNEIKPRDESVRPFLLDDFVWRPFTKPLRNWNPPRFYNEKAKRVSDDDDEFVSFARCVLPLSQVFQKLGEGIKKAEQLTNKKRKQANENAMDCCETQDEEEDNITTARRIKCRNKCGDVKYTGDQRTSTEEDCNVPGLPQKLASGDEHNSSDPNVSSDGVHEKDEDGNTTIAQIIKLRDNVENNTEGVEYVPVVYNNVSGLPQKLASGDKTVAVPEIKERSEVNDETNNSSDALVASNGIAEMEEEYVTVGERLNQRKLGTDELALKLEARMLKEWSAYGVGVPLLYGVDSFVQYYVPYLSGIQLYQNPSRASTSSRRAGEDSYGDSPSDMSSDGSNDCRVLKQSLGSPYSDLNENQRVGTLLIAAEEWLRRLKVVLSDFIHFVSHSDSEMNILVVSKI